MEKYTLLELVNTVGETMDYETYNDIGETPESERIARIARTVFYKLLVDFDWKHLHVLTRLEGMNDTDRPMVMKVPENVSRVHSIWYDKTPDDGDDLKVGNVTYVDPEEFLYKSYRRKSTRDNVSEYTTGDGQVLLIQTDKAPEYYTSFDDTHVVFDSFDSAVEHTLHAEKSMVYGVKGKVWTNENDFIPPLPAEHFPMYLSKVIVEANAKLRQVTMRDEMRDFTAAKNRMRRTQRVEELNEKPNYGWRRR